MQGSELLAFPWLCHNQSSNIYEPTKALFKPDENSDILPIKFNDENTKDSAVLLPAPFEHPYKDSSQNSEEDQYISRFDEKEADNLDGDSSGSVQLELCDKELWDQFSNVGTEMIVTKTGRRMFPGYRIKVTGLNPDQKYCIMMDIVNVDDNRYKFQHGEWAVAGRGEPHIPQRFFLHPDSPARGSKWMKDPISFHKVKLTNSVGQDIDGKVVLNSMHRYQPRVHIVQADDPYSTHNKSMYTFAFPQTVFITVTAYQNAEVTKLKIDNNPFAKGFRDDGARSKKTRMDNIVLPPRKLYPEEKLDNMYHMQHQQQQYTHWTPHNTQPINYHHQMPQQMNYPQHEHWRPDPGNMQSHNVGYQYQPQNQHHFTPIEYPEAVTSTPQKPYYDPQEQHYMPPVYDEKQRSDSGIGWSPTGSLTDEESSFISVGGPDNSFTQPQIQQTNNFPAIVNKQHEALQNLEGLPAQHDHLTDGWSV